MSAIDLSGLAPDVVMRDCMRMFGLVDLMVRPLMAMSKVRELTMMLSDPNPAIRQMAVTVLGRTQTHGVPALLSALDAAKQPASVRVAAIQALGLDASASTATSSIAAMNRCLSDPDEVVRDQAALALSRVGGPAVPMLRDALRSPDDATRTAAAVALSRCGPGAKDAIEDLKRVATSSPSTASPAIYAALVRVTGDANLGVPHLSKMMRDDDPSVRSAAARAAAELGPAGLPLQEALMGRMVDASPIVRAEAAKAIVKVAPDSPRTQAALVNLLHDGSPDVRSAAATVLPMLGSTVRPALESLSKGATGRDLAFLQSGMLRIDSLRRAPSVSNIADTWQAAR